MSEQATLVVLPHNVVAFEQSLRWHAAATHVLGLALSRARVNGRISAEHASQVMHDALEHMDVAEVRQTITLVLEDSKHKSHAESA